MNRFMQENWSWVDGSHQMRTGILDTLTDEDLSFSPGGTNLSFGMLIRELGEVQTSYLRSFQTHKQDWDYRNTEPGLDRSGAQLKAWFQSMDDELKATITAFSDEDLKGIIERPGGFSMPVEQQLTVYLQVLFIFFGKSVVYLRAMNKPLPPALQEYIG